jgi:anti-sigma factor (TIGR02949 family)
MTDCTTVGRQIWDYLDHEMTAERREVINAHIRACRDCFSLVRFDAAFLQRVRAVKDTPLFVDDLRQRLAAAMREQGVAPPDTLPTTTAESP